MDNEDYNGDFLIDGSTGEIKRKMKNGDKISSKKQRDFYKKIQQKKDVQQYVNAYAHSFNFAQKKDLATYGALIVLATYLKFDSEELPFKSISAVEAVLDVSNRQTRTHLKTLKDLDIIYKNENGFYCIRKEYFNKGNIVTGNFVKIYQLTTRDLVLNNSLSNIGILALLLPYLNYKYNVLTLNVQEQDLKKITPLSYVDLALCLNITKKQLYNLFRNLKMSFCEKEFYVVAFFKVGDRKSLVVNPLVANRRASFDSGLVKLFEA